MKTNIQVFTSILCILISVMANTPSKASSRLTGPRAKNVKFGQQSTNRASAILVSRSPRSMKGVRAKQYKPWKGHRSNNTTEASTPRVKRLTGPRAKNAKPWKKQEEFRP